MRPRANIIRVMAIGTALAVASAAFAQEATPLEQVPLGQSIVMALFIALATLIVLSLACKLLVAFGFGRANWIGRLVHALASIVGNVRTTRGGSSRASQSDDRGGGGSFGGGGASGRW